MVEAWVTPGRIKNPYSQLTWNPSTMTWAIDEVNTDPYNYGTLDITSQASKNITQGIPVTYNQYSGCPLGQVMGPDGRCRPVKGWKGTAQIDLPDLTIPDPIDPTPEPTPEPFKQNVYQGSGQDITTDQTKVWTGNVTGNTYANLPGGFNNWSNETFYDYGLDKGYFTEDGLVGAQKTGFAEGSMWAAAAQYMNDKKFKWWLDAAQKRGIFELSYDTEGVLESATLLKQRGSVENAWGGGMLEDIAKKTKDTSEKIWQSLVAEPVSLMRQYDERTVNVPISSSEDEAKLQIDVTNELLEDEYRRQEEWNATGYYTNRSGEKFGPGPKIGLERAKGSQLIDDLEKEKAAYLKQLETGNFSSIEQEQMFDPLLGEWVKKSPGLMAEKERSERAQKLLEKQQKAELSKIKPKLKPEGMFNIGTVTGNKANNMVTASHGQYIGSSVYKNPGGGYYQQNGKFVNSDGQVSSKGSMSDSIYAMANGTAVDSVLDRTLKNKGSVNVMKKEALKMKQAGKLTQAEYDKVTNYSSKSDYQKDSNNKTIHENGEVTKITKEKKGTTKPGTSGGYKPAGQGSAGNTGSKSKKKDKIICTEMYRQTNLHDWKEAMKLWYLFQKKHLTPTHQVGYHFLFKPFVKGMKKSKILTAIGSHFAKQRTKDIKHIMFGTKYSLLGRIYRIIFEPICYTTGLLLTYKEKRAWQ